jgi:hypothetical protein
VAALARKLVVEIVGDSSSLERAFGRASKSGQTMGYKIQRGALLAGSALTAGLAVAAKIGFGELAKGQEVAAQTEAVLKSTGAVANVTAQEVAGLAQEQSNLTGIDDELIQSGENLLLTFKNIHNEVGKGNDIFNRATKSALDLSKAGFGSVETTAKQLGKALNDPVRGMTALGRAGVTFSQQQRDAIKAMVETGNTLGAQRLILKEVESQVGGSAAAWGTTLPGQLAKARNAFEEMAAGLTVILLPALLKVSSVVARVAQFFTEHEGAAKVLGATLVTLAGVLLTVGVASKLYAAGQAIAAAATATWTAAQWLLNAALTANPIGVVVVALAALVGGLVLAYKHSETFRRIVDAAFKAVKTAAEAVLNFFRDNWKTIAILITGPFAPLVALATDAFGIRSKLIAGATAILDFFKGNWKTIAVLISGPFAPLVALATDAFGVRSALVNAFGAILEAVREKMGALISFVRGIPAKIVGALGNLGSLLFSAGAQIVQGLIDGIYSKLSALKDAAANAAKAAASAMTFGLFGSPKFFSYYLGQGLITQMGEGMEEKLPDLQRMASSVGQSLAIPLPETQEFNGASFDFSNAEPLPATVVESLGLTTEAITVATAEIGAFTTAITALPSVASDAFTAMTKTIVSALSKIPETLAPATTALLAVAEAIGDIGNNAYYARAALRETVQDIIDLWARLAAKGIPIPGPIPGKAAGGPVRAGSPYIVGEAGPELFVPSSSGTIHTAGATARMAGGGPTIVQLNFHGPTVGTSRDFEDTVRRALYDISRRNPGTGLALA